MLSFSKRKSLNWLVSVAIVALVPAGSVQADTSGIPGVPQNPVVSKRTSSYLLISWETPLIKSESAIDYELRYSDDAGSKWMIYPDGVSTQTEMRLDALQQNKEYWLQIRSIGPSINSDWVDVASGFLDLSVAPDYACGIQLLGTVICWSFVNKIPVDIRGVTNAVSISSSNTTMTSGHARTCAVLQQGQIRCWVFSVDDKYITKDTSVFMFDPGFKNVAKVALGRNHLCALINDGSVNCAGENIVGQLGDGSNGGAKSSSQVKGITSAIDISAGGDQTCAILANHSVKCWGWHRYELSPNNYIIDDRNSPFEVVNLSNPKDLSVGGYHACALEASGYVKCWGSNNYRQLHNGTRDSWDPIEATAIQDATQVASGAASTCALLIDEMVSCWGEPWGVTTGFSNVAKVLDQCALLRNGIARCWTRSNMSFPAEFINEGTTPTLFNLLALPHAVADLSTGSPTASTIAVSWAVPSADGLPVDNYKIEWSTNGTDWTSAESSQTSTTLTGLSPATAYQIRVSAHSEAGWGAPSTVLQTRTANPPSATTVTLQSRTASTITVSWTAPDAEGLPVDNYKIEWSTNGTDWTSAESSQTTTTLTGLSPATTYQVRVSAHSEAGWGTPSTVKPFTTGGLLTYTSGAKVSGTAVVGRYLTATTGTWTSAPKATFKYQWYACTKASKTVSTIGKIATGCSAISRATASSIKLTTTSKGKYIAVLITGKNSAGSKKVFTATVGSVK